MTSAQCEMQMSWKTQKETLQRSDAFFFFTLMYSLVFMPQTTVSVMQNFRSASVKKKNRWREGEGVKRSRRKERLNYRLRTT